MEKYSYICGAERNICDTNTDLGGVPDLHIVLQCVSFLQKHREHRFLCTY